MPKSMDIVIKGDRIDLQREQWDNNVAYITNYPGLLDEVKKYTWTYTTGEHPYLNCSVLKLSLHKFVLQFLYGKEKLDEMIGKLNIIEHLDNNGLNCTYENLHVLSADMNKAKAFSIDKRKQTLETGQVIVIPALITDVYYSHENKYFQLQVYFNKNIAINPSTKKYVEKFILQYNDFDSLFIDWLYCYKCRENESFDISKHHAVKFYSKDITLIEPREAEKDAIFFERNGKLYLRINTDKENGPLAFMNHIPFKKIEENKK